MLVCLGFEFIKILKCQDDTNTQRTVNLIKVSTLQMKYAKVISEAININFTSNFLECRNSIVFIITVPTPVNKNEPDLKNLKEAANLVARIIKKEM